MLATSVATTSFGAGRTVARFTFSPSAPITGHLITLDASSSACANNPCTYAWNVDASGTSWSLGSGQVLTHAFGRSGVKDITLTVTDASGQTSTTQQSINVAASGGTGPPADVASFTYSPSAPVTGQAVSFDASSSTCATSPCTYAWDDDGPDGTGGSSWPLGTGQTLAFTFQGTGTKYVRLTITDAGGQTATVEQNVVVASSGSPPPNAPVNTGLPAISGTPQQGQTLTASSGTWTGSPTGYSYAWSDGAQGSSHTLTAADVGRQISVTVTATNAAGSTNATSAGVGPVTGPGPPSAPTNTGLPSISGTAQQGQTLNASNGSWTGSPTNYGYQWRDCSSGSCSNISGATSSSYTLTSGEVGDTVVVVVKATNSGGSASATSAATSPITASGSGGNAGGGGSDCFSAPGSCGYPDPNYGNVGPSSACSSLTASGSVTAATAGQTVQNLNVTGTITVSAPNVTINNVCVTTNGGGQLGSTAITVTGNASNTLIENTTVAGANTSNQSVEIAAKNWSGNSATISDDYFYNCGECIHDGPWTVNDSYIIANGMQGTADHYEDVYCNSSTVAMNHDTALNPEEQVAAVFCDTNDGSGGPCTNDVSVSNSLLGGGGYTLYPCGNASSAGSSSMSITNNRFARCTTPPFRQTSDGGWDCQGSTSQLIGSGDDSNGYWPYGGHYGVDSDTYCPPTNGNTWSGNVWDDNGANVAC